MHWARRHAFSSMLGLPSALPWATMLACTIVHCSLYLTALLGLRAALYRAAYERGSASCQAA